MSELEKNHLKKSDKKQKINVNMPRVNKKPIARMEILFKQK